MNKAVTKRGSFEQVFLEQAFTYSTMDSVENTDKMLRALKGLLVQKHTREVLGDDTDVYLERLAEWERKPLAGVNKDVYSVCDWLREGVDELVLWNDGKPVKKVKVRLIRGEIRLLLDELNIMAGELCDVMNIKPLSLSSKKFSWFQRRGEQDVA